MLTGGGLYLQNRIVEAEYHDNPYPRRGVAEVELHKDISLRTELWKRNFLKMFP